MMPFLSIREVDESVTLAVNGLHTALSDQFWRFMSDKKVWIPFYLILITLLLYRLGWKKTLLAVFCTALTILACDQTAELFKYSVGRLRPCYNLDMVEGGLRILEGRGHLFGFFSAHAADCFGLGACLGGCMLMKDKGKGRGPFVATLFIWALLVSTSRVFLGKHFVGDVLTGALIGMTYGFIASRMAIFLSKRLAFFPEN